jgi:putative ABC transport system permease protein
MIEDMQGEMQEMTFNQIITDYDYLDAMGIPLVAGRYYDRKFGSDQNNSIVVNEAVVRAMQWGDSALGKKFKLAPNVQNITTPDAEVIGVVKDYNYGSLHNPIEPLVFVCRENIPFLRLLHIRVENNQMQDVLNWVVEKRNAFNPSYPIQYSYLSEELDSMYEEEHVVFALVISFTILIIFIAALGLLGLSSFMTVKRTRETGIRRVMGASQNQILSLFLIQFAKWVIISNVIAWPVSYFVIKPWLQNFTYRIDFPFWTFIISLLLSLTIAVITVSWQSLKASRMNPAASIRVE